ncbi:SH3 domain-containing protein [Massilia sp. TS11]|uniref:SH3 domain-containing protein n=1 Tax=Massilia sp. TS11 TaxID=2908003 RepID=UPI001EDB81F3|nr:SH3 domain-containing protein [Massilia sp. TS11]MCG2585847.1 SH3 domain-containing protein [Massilia sp. TS11]
MSLPLRACLGLLLAAASAQAAEFRSVGPAPAIVYDAPSPKGNKLYVAPRGMPVEILITHGDWLKVRDANGDAGWVELKSLAGRRTVVARNANVKVRANADEHASPVLVADKGVLLELLEPAPSAWAKVRHRDGISGYVKVNDVFGL